jgi:hemolysin D
MIRILLVDDQKSIREWLKSLLETEPDFEIVGMVDNGYDAIEQVKLLLPDVVLMDMEMPDIDGILATKIIADSSLKTKVLVLTSYDSQDYVTKSIYAGAKGYILKGAPTEKSAKQFGLSIAGICKLPLVCSSNLFLIITTVVKLGYWK